MKRPPDDVAAVLEELQRFGLAGQVERTARRLRVVWTLAGRTFSVVCTSRSRTHDGHAAMNARALVRRYIRAAGLEPQRGRP